jgi:hypothetical protein
MHKNHIRLSVILCGLALIVVTCLPAKSYPPFVRKAAKFGAQDCLFCHTEANGGEGWNDRGKWLMAERDKRKADSIDVEWLAEYKTTESKEGEKKEGDAKEAPAASGTSGEHTDHDKSKDDKAKPEDKDKDKDKDKKKPGTDKPF